MIRGNGCLLVLDTRLQAHGFLHGARFGLADAAIAPFVRQFSHTDPGWFARQPWPNLERWLAAFEGSESYLGVMDKTPAWVQGQEPVLFPSH